MFRQVLKDLVAVDYAKTLVSHLHEAVNIPQRHAVREWQKQAEGYNRKVRHLPQCWRQGTSGKQEQEG